MDYRFNFIMSDEDNVCDELNIDEDTKLDLIDKYTCDFSGDLKLVEVLNVGK